jgi:hypothetical protein
MNCCDTLPLPDGHPPHHPLTVHQPLACSPPIHQRPDPRRPPGPHRPPDHQVRCNPHCCSLHGDQNAVPQSTRHLWLRHDYYQPGRLHPPHLPCKPLHRNRLCGLPHNQGLRYAGPLHPTQPSFPRRLHADQQRLDQVQVHQQAQQHGAMVHLRGLQDRCFQLPVSSPQRQVLIALIVAL